MSLQPQPPALDDRAENAFATVSAPGTDPLTRAEAADRLIAFARDPLVAERIIGMLQSEAEPHEPRAALLAAIGRVWAPPPRLYRTLAQLATGPTTAPPALVYPAVAAYRTPDALLVLIKHLSIRSPEANRIAAAEALISVTGRDDLGADRLAWMRWFNQVRGLDAASFHARLAEGVWRRENRVRAERAAVGAKLIEISRRLYLALPSEGAERPRYLVQLLGDATAELRTLGLDIVAREISDGKAIDSGVVEGVAKLLESPDPSARARAAVLSSQLAPTGIAERIAGALQRESNPLVASKLLVAAARWPSAEVAGPAVHWLERAYDEAPESVDALVALRAAGEFKDADLQARAAAVLGAIPTDQLTPAGCRLLADIGSDEDRQHIASLLTSPMPLLRAAAADALSPYEAFCDQIIEAARTDARLFAVAVRAVSAHRRNAEACAALYELPAQSAEIRREGLVLASLYLPLPELVKFADIAAEDPDLRDAVLEPLTHPTVDLNPEPTKRALRAHALCLLAETRLALGRPERALAALETLPEPLPEEVDKNRIRRLLALSLLWTNQVERAAELDTSPDDWMDALELALSEDHAPDLLEQIRTRFGPLLTEDQRVRLEGLAGKLESMGPPPPQG